MDVSTFWEPTPTGILGHRQSFEHRILRRSTLVNISVFLADSHIESLFTERGSCFCGLIDSYVTKGKDKRLTEYENTRKYLV